MFIFFYIICTAVYNTAVVVDRSPFFSFAFFGDTQIAPACLSVCLLALAAARQLENGLPSPCMDILPCRLASL